MSNIEKYESELVDVFKRLDDIAFFNQKKVKSCRKRPPPRGKHGIDALLVNVRARILSGV